MQSREYLQVWRKKEPKLGRLDSSLYLLRKVRVSCKKRALGILGDLEHFASVLPQDEAPKIPMKYHTNKAVKLSQ